MRIMKSSKPIFITGCDSKHEWMLPFLEKRFEKHNPEWDLYVFNFDDIFPELNGWFKKPALMLQASTWAPKICWLDTDIEIRGNLSGIWDYVQDNKLAMAVDAPWTNRRPERGRWYNSGVVAYERQPPVLYEWNRIISEGNHGQVGDQEVLNWMMGGDPLRELTHLNELPRIYNTLRLDLLDGTAPPNPKIIHWTGYKGKEKIKEMMNE